MSCYDEERGSFTFTVGEWAKFKKAIRRDILDIEEKQYNASVLAWKAVVDRPSNAKKEAMWHGQSTNKGFAYLAERALERSLPEGSGVGNFVHRLYEGRDESKNPLKPLKKNYIGPLRRNIYGKGLGFMLSLDDQYRVADWSVRENNHAVTEARENPIARSFFHRLSQVKWNAKSGGCVEYQSEYTREDFGLADIKDEFGGIAEDNRRHSQPRRRF